MTRIVPLGDIVEIKGGGTPDKSVESYWGGEIPWASVKDFKSTEITQTVDSITPLGVANSATNIIPAGSILVPTRMAVGKVAINAVDMAINQDLKALKVKAGVDTRYLLNALMAKAPSLEAQATGATVKGITLDVLRSLEIPLPPLEEQKRIAAILDQADDLRRKRQQAIDRLNQLGQAIFYEMFGKEGTTVRISEYLDDIQSGKNLVGVSDDDESGFRVLKISAVSRTGFRPSETKPLPSNYIPPSEHFVSNGDLIFSRANTTELIGIPCIVEGVEPNVALPDKLWRLVAAPQKADRNFLNFALRSPSSRQQIEKMCSGTSGSMQNISMQKFNSILIPKAHLGDQKKFAERVCQVGVVIQQTSVQQRTTKALFASLQHRAFSGAL